MLMMGSAIKCDNCDEYTRWIDLTIKKFIKNNKTIEGNCCKECIKTTKKKTNFCGYCHNNISGVYLICNCRKKISKTLSPLECLEKVKKDRLKLDNSNRIKRKNFSNILRDYHENNLKECIPEGESCTCYYINDEIIHCYYCKNDLYHSRDLTEKDNYVCCCSVIGKIYNQCSLCHNDEKNKIII